MQNTPNFKNGIKERFSSAKALSWQDLEDNFKYGNSWEEGKNYKEGMIVWHNDYIDENNFDRGMSQWLCKSDNISSNENAPGISDFYMPWERLLLSSNTGPIGETGPMGEQGEQGVTGPTGEQGPIGGQGPIGDQGLIGGQGPTGEKGPIGEQGLTGPTGEQGVTGPIGETGIQGIKGATAFDKGTNHVVVRGTGTPIENGIELLAAYQLAGTMSPGVDNRVTVIIAPGIYDLNTETFLINTPYIDITSLTGERDVIFYSTNAVPIYVSTNNTSVTGLVSSGKFDIISGSNIIIKNCKGGNYAFNSSFLGSTVITSTFIDCEGGNYSFGYCSYTSTNNTISGTFINCKGGDYSFGYTWGGGVQLSIDGVFENCIGGNDSFGHFTSTGETNIISGTFINCTALSKSFGYYTSASGTPILNITSGVFNNCTSGDDSFGYILGGGNEAYVTLNLSIFTNCIAGNNSFGYSNSLTATTQILSGSIFTNCIAGNNSFGYTDGSVSSTTISGIFIKCNASINSLGYCNDISQTFITTNSKFYYCKCTNSEAINSSHPNTFFCVVGGTPII